MVKARSGEKMLDLSSQYGISTKTIYGWLRADTGKEVVSVLKYNQLKRIIGKLTLEMSLGKKAELTKESKYRGTPPGWLGSGRDER